MVFFHSGNTPHSNLGDAQTICTLKSEVKYPQMFFGCSSAISVAVGELSSLNCVTSFIKVYLIFMAVWGVPRKFRKNDNSDSQTCFEFKDAVSFISITVAANNNLFRVQLCSS